MRKIDVPLTSFAFGEISRSAIGRTDTAVYTASAQELKNVVLLPEGGVLRRHGSQIIHQPSITYDSSYSKQTRCIPFIFSNDERYLIVMSDARLDIYRVYANDALTPAHIQTITTQSDTGGAVPFSKDYIQEYNYAQAGDVMIFCHRLMYPRELVRTSINTFSLQSLTFDTSGALNRNYCPFSRLARPDIYVIASSTTGNTPLYCNENYFTPEMVGNLLLIGKTEALITSYVNAKKVNVTLSRELSFTLQVLNPLRSTEGSQTVEVTYIGHGFKPNDIFTLRGASTIGDTITGAYLNTTHVVYDVLDENTFQFTAGISATSSEDGGGTVELISGGPFYNWYEQSFTGRTGYPSAVTFHEGRLVFGGTLAEPDGLFFSKSGNYYNFDTGDALDGEAIQLTCDGSEVRDIRYLVSNRDLQVFTSNAEFYVPAYVNQPLTPSNAVVKEQTPFGAAWVRPASLDGGTIFVPETRRAVREYIFTDTQNAYSAPNLATIARDLASGIHGLTVVNGLNNTGEPFAVFTTDEDRAVLFTSNRSEKRAGWCQWELGGTAIWDDVAHVDGTLYATIWFYNGSTWWLHVVRFRRVCQLDRAAFYTPSSGIIDTTDFFVNGETLGVVAEGFYVGTITAGASVDVSGLTNASVVQVGHPYYASVTTNPIDLMLPTGPMTGEYRGIYRAILDLNLTTHVTVNGRVKDWGVATSGKYEFHLLGYDRDPDLTITQTKPEAFQLNAVTMGVGF